MLETWLLIYHPEGPEVTPGCPNISLLRLDRFNVNLYSDGKVCLSLLGSATGASASGGDKWNPETSSLWQVIVPSK